MGSSSYFDLSRPDDGRENTAYFVLDSLLKSRIECGFESSAEHHDENVNVYLVHLLSSLVEAPATGALAAPRDIDVFEKVRRSQDARFKCEVYRTHADQLLVATGIFSETPYVEREGRRTYDGLAQDRIGRGKAYYRFASTFHGRTGARTSALALVLARLSDHFERYVDVLFHMRGEYFHLYERLREDDFRAVRDAWAAGDAGDVDVETLRNEFLDAYWLWHQDPGAAARDALIEAVKRLRAADPSFDFRLPSQ
jgi:hypothetical protein